MEIKTIRELQKGDRVLIQVDDNNIEIHTVKIVSPFNGTFVSDESYPLDIEFEDDEQIVILSEPKPPSALMGLNNRRYEKQNQNCSKKPNGRNSRTINFSKSSC